MGVRRPKAVAIGGDISAAPAPSACLATALDGLFLPAARSRTVLWLLQRKSCRRRLQVEGARTHVAAWLDRHEVGGQKGQMGIFANATLVTDRSHPMELSLGAKRGAGRSGRRVRLG